MIVSSMRRSIIWCQHPSSTAASHVVGGIHWVKQCFQKPRPAKPPALTSGSRRPRSTLCTVQLCRVDWQHEADAAAAQQRTIDSLEAGIAAGGDPELLLDAAEAEDVVEQGATVVVGVEGLDACLSILPARSPLARRLCGRHWASTHCTAETHD